MVDTASVLVYCGSAFASGVALTLMFIREKPAITEEVSSAKKFAASFEAAANKDASIAGSAVKQIEGEKK